MNGLTWVEVSGTAPLTIEPPLVAPMVESLSGSDFVDGVAAGFVEGSDVGSIAFPDGFSLILIISGGPSVSEASEADEGDTNESPVIRRLPVSRVVYSASETLDEGTA